MRLGRTVLNTLGLLGVLVPGLGAQEVVRPNSAAQSGAGRIAGAVVIAETGEPLNAAAITIRGATDSAVVAGSLTAQDGKFRIEGLVFGRYLVRVSHLGYRPRTLDLLVLSPAAPAADVGSIKMEVAPVELPGVEAAAQRSAVVIEADRTVYDTKELPSAAGTAIDVLRNVPELEVDLNGKIALRGNQGVAIHLNGRPAPMRGEQLTNYLQQLPGNRISKVEVVPNPSAKHDPEGMGGIVNIVLKENVDLGVSGSLSLNASTRNSRGLNGRFNWQRGRLTLFSGGGIGLSDNEADNYDLRQNLIAQPVSYIEQVSHRVYDGLSHNFDLTAEFRLAARSTIWTSAWAYGSNDNMDMFTQYGILDDARVARERYDRATLGEGRFGGYDVTLGFKHVFQPQRHELTVDVRRSAGNNDQDSEWTREYEMALGQPVDWPIERTFTDIDGDNRNLSVQADYFRPLGTGRLELGYRAWKRGEGNDNLMRVFAAPEALAPASNTRTAYDHDEIFHSVYTTVSRSLGKLNAQVGLRAELAGTTFALPTEQREFDNDYNSLFPSASLAYTFRPGRTARISYSKRIGRPYPYILNPSVPNNDPLNLYMGNPEIRPTYTHQLNMDLSWVGPYGSLRLTPNYRRTVDNWDQIRRVDAQGVSTMTWANVDLLQVFGSSLIASLRPTNRLNGSLNLTAYRELRDARSLSPDSNEYSRNYWRMSASLNGGYKIVPSLTASANVRYTPPYTLIQGRAAGMTYSSVGVRQQVWGTRGSVSLFVNDPFDLYRFRFDTSDRAHVQSSRSTMKMRMATLSFTYNFGKPPEQNSRRQTDESAAPSTIIR